MFVNLYKDNEALALAKPRQWFPESFQGMHDMHAVVVQGYPQGNSNPCYHLERVVS